MGRGPKKHLKRVNAPKHWMLDKLSGHYAPRPSAGPHKLRECLPLAVLLKNKLKYALNGTEILSIVKDKEGLIYVDGKVRRDPKYPTGFMDVVTIPRTGESFRMLYDVKGRFVPVRIEEKEAGFKLCQVKRRAVGATKAPFITTHDARTIRFAHPSIKQHDTVKINLETGEIEDHIKFETGNLALITGGNNVGRVGIVTHRERHPGSFEIVHLRDLKGHTFATRLQNVFVIGAGKKAAVTLPKGDGIKLSVLEERAVTVEAARKASA